MSEQPGISDPAHITNVNSPVERCNADDAPAQELADADGSHDETGNHEENVDARFTDTEHVFVIRPGKAALLLRSPASDSISGTRWVGAGANRQPRNRK